MTTFLISNLMGIITGIIVKILVPLPFLDQPVRDAWSWVWKKVQSIG